MPHPLMRWRCDNQSTNGIGRPAARRAAAGESKSLLAKEFGIDRETVYSYLRAEPAVAVTG
ncbi:hypothetical protein ACQP2U_21215 [Nocardia sp. CA-084685]|uniref:hypothetical protein n=1 Tax=Nocardia sp. CA-084685 TaxID=3239970 RepID=UPI003D97A216